MNRAVKRGVKLFDARGPDNWFLRVDPETLDLSNQHHCVVGQVYGRYGQGLAALGVESEDRYGFLPGYGRRRVNAWREVILARKRRYFERALFSLEDLFNEELSEEDRKAYSRID